MDTSLHPVDVKIVFWKIKGRMPRLCNKPCNLLTAVIPVEKENQLTAGHCPKCF